MLQAKAQNLLGRNITSTSPQGWSWNQIKIPIPASTIPNVRDNWIDSNEETKSLNLSFSVEL